ncbi:MAG TPA: DNA/RNA non-specific endonuclease [Flavobacteriia bacterium]|nr:DNA/RNA non-specific endonuclease [Flavobacteriia bacterium]
MKTKRILTLVFAIVIAGIAYYQKQQNVETETGTVPDYSTDFSFDFLPTSTTNQVVHQRYYSLSYNEKKEQPEWVAYALLPSQLKRIDRKRPYFIKDKKVKTKSADYRNYKNSGYDKGHLCPAGDRRFSKDAFDETFLTSNIAPQNHEFNAGIWNRLEQKTRYWTKKYGKLYVITGGILTDKNLKTIGREKVAVPNRFYKIILDYKGNKAKAIAFIMPNKDSDKPLYQFTTTIDHIEALTRIDFFTNLPDSIENKIEKENNYKNWSFRY